LITAVPGDPQRLKRNSRGRLGFGVRRPGSDGARGPERPRDGARL